MKTLDMLRTVACPGLLTDTRDRRMQAEQHERFVAAARELLKPSPVRHCYMPPWFRLAVRRTFKGPSYESNASQAAWNRLQRAMPDLRLDHWGSTVRHGRSAFVSEPYCCTGHIAAGKQLAERLGFGFEIDPNSWWFPGRTTRLVWYELPQQDGPT